MRMTAATLRASALIGALAFAFPAWPTLAQEAARVQSDILTLDPDRLFADTQVGQRLIDQYEEERDRLIADNRELEAELRAEEQALTDARKDMTPTEFRAKADAFDDKVRSIRQESERKVRDLERGREIAPLTLMRMAEPILLELMRDTGGAIILDNRQVLLRADAIDITDLAIERIDAAIGDGSRSMTPDGTPIQPEGGVAGPEAE